MTDSSKLASRRGALSPSKRALLDKRLKGESYDVDRIVISKRAPGSLVRASFAQERLWFLEQLVPGSPAYNLNFAYRIRGALNTRALSDSVTEIVRRHEVLRTTFYAVDGVPYQAISSDLKVTIPLIDLKDLPPEERMAEARRLVSATKPFNIASDLLIRASIIELEDEDHVLAVNLHHIIFDGWSMMVFIEELADLYGHFSKGIPSSLPELKIQFADYAAWERERLQGEGLDRLYGYWEEQLRGAPLTMELLTDRRRPAIQNLRGASTSFSFSIDLSRALVDLANRENCTLFMVLMAGLATLFLRYSGQEDICIGSPIANRNDDATRSLIGFFANTLVFRVRLEGNPSFLELLKRVRNVSLGAYEHQNLPFEKLVERIRPDRDMSRQPLFQVMLTLQNVPSARFQLPELDIDSWDMPGSSAKFDLWFSLVESDAGMLGTVDYDSDLFDSPTIARMSTHWQSLLAAAVQTPAQRILDLPLLTESERKQFARWNATDHEYAWPDNVYQCFELQAKRTPDATAVGCGKETLTYRQLSDRVAQLAAYLGEAGIGPDVPVGIFMERSIDLVVAILGILHAGGAYVPLEPTYPGHRLEFMVQDAHVELIITCSALAGRVPRMARQVLCIDDCNVFQHATPATHGVMRAVGDNLAYILYTSGSTGKPKAVMNTHRALGNRLLWMQDAYQLTSKDCVLQKTPFSFDVSVWEFLWPLATGARLFLAKPDGHKDTSYLLDVIREQAVTVVHFVPSMLQMFMENSTVVECSSLRDVICSGEVLSPELRRRFCDKLSANLHNLYGPTEAAIDVTSWACERNDQRDSVPIGRPIANIQIYILDSHLNLVPPGVPGEIHVGGIGLARGYLNRPDLTADRFIPNLHANRPGERLYRTGDLGRWRPDGAIEYLDRLDNQVKIRGCRVELGEIDNELQKHPAVLDVVSVVHACASDDKWLVSYVVPSRQFLSREVRIAEETLEAEELTHWESVFDDTYARDTDRTVDGINFAGWNSSYTRKPISNCEMTEWLKFTSQRVLALTPRNVLDIGCGTGSLLFHLAPAVNTYMGTDVSQTAVDYLSQRIGEIESGNSRKIQFIRRRAHEFAQYERERYDVVILNSVIQYFPSIEYFFKVLQGAVDATADGGAVFIGDVRNLSLLELFRYSIELHKTTGQVRNPQLWWQARQSILQEQELALAPELFEMLPLKCSRIQYSKVLLKRGRSSNELTNFRYDVVLHIDSSAPAQRKMEWLHWQKDGLALASVRQLLEGKPPLLAFTCVPNRRLAQYFSGTEHEDGGRAIAGFTEKPQMECAQGEDPEEFWQLAEQYGYECQISWTHGYKDGRFDVLLTGHTANPNDVVLGPYSESLRPWRDYANTPLAWQVLKNLRRELRVFLKGVLPEYSIPSVITTMPELPVTQSGKVDRGVLALLDISGFNREEHSVAPEDHLCRRLAELWSGVLGMDRVGIHDNFFGIGGDSIRVLRCVAAARDAGLSVRPQEMFMHQTIAELAEVIRGRDEVGEHSPSLVPDSREHVESLPISSSSGSQQRSYSPSDFPLADLDQHNCDLHLAGLDVEDVFPLSGLPDDLFAQYLANPEAGLNLVQRVEYLTEEVDAARFDDTLQALAAGHSVLRTSFIWKGLPHPLQVVHTRAVVPFEQEDWRGLSKASQEQKLQEYLSRDAEYGPQLSKPAPLRLFMARLDDKLYVTVLTFNYMCIDGWTLALLSRDLYASLNHGKQIEYKSSFPYRQYIAWLRTQDWTRVESFWRNELKGAELPTPLVDQMPGNLRSKEIVFENQRTTLSPLVTRGVRLLARQHNLTENTFFLAAWALLVSHYSREHDVVLGVTITGRSVAVPGVLSISGYTMNYLPVRLHIDHGEEFMSLVGRVHKKQVDLVPYEHTPLGRIRKCCRLRPELLLFESIFYFQNLGGPTIEEAVTQFFAKTAYPLRIDVFPRRPEVGTEIFASYHRKYFDPVTMARLLNDYSDVMSMIVDNPFRVIGDCVSSFVEK